MTGDKILPHLLAVYFFLLLHKHVEGQGCDYWGQGCWGGHGKRDPYATSDWFMNKLLATRYPSLDDIYGSSSVVRGPIAAQESSIARVKSNTEINAPWKNGLTMPVNQPNEGLSKYRLYELLSG